MGLWKAGFAALVALSATPVLAAEPVGDAIGRDYISQIRPLLTKHCAKCHGAAMKEGGVEFASIAKRTMPGISCEYRRSAGVRELPCLPQ